MKRLLSIVSLSICCISIAAHLSWLANASRGGDYVAKNAMPMISPSQCSDFAILDNGYKSEDYAEPSVADFFNEVFPIKGYADTLTMRHWNNGTTPDSLRGYQITLTDTQTCPKAIRNTGKRLNASRGW